MIDIISLILFCAIVYMGGTAINREEKRKKKMIKVLKECQEEKEDDRASDICVDIGKCFAISFQSDYRDKEIKKEIYTTQKVLEKRAEKLSQKQ